MGRKSKHHYIPKCYLKGFTNGGENSSKFWAVPNNNAPAYPTSPNDACAKRDYYTVNHKNSLVVEEFYAAQVESKIIHAINYINTNLCLPPKEGMAHLILLLATLYLRVPSHRECLEAPLRRSKEIVESMSREVDFSNKKAFSYSNTDLIKTELSLIDTVLECLSDKYYQLHVIEEENLNVITSDKPFIMTHPYGDRKGFHYGLSTPNIEIFVPITSKAILIARNEKMEEGAFRATKKLIGFANTMLKDFADKVFFSKTEEIVFVDENFSLYNYKISTKK